MSVNSIFKSVLGNMVPTVAGEMICILLTEHKIGVAEMTKLVQENKSLWETLPESHGKVRKILLQTGNLKWLTSEWAINSLREQHPGLCSLFLSWPEAQKWLEAQVNEIKKGVTNDDL